MTERQKRNLRKQIERLYRRVAQLEARRGSLRPALAEFAAYMEYKLRMNDHKPHWRTCCLGYLRDRLGQELAELDEALTVGDPHCIYEECADVANLAMMIADKTQAVDVEGV